MKRTGTGNPLPHHTRAPHPPIGDCKHFKHWLYFTLLALAPLLELCWCLNWYNFTGWVPRRSGGVPKVHPAHEVKRKIAKDKSNDHLRRWHRFYCTVHTAQVPTPHKINPDLYSISLHSTHSLWRDFLWLHHMKKLFEVVKQPPVTGVIIEGVELSEEESNWTVWRSEKLRGVGWAEVRLGQSHQSCLQGWQQELIAPTLPA